MTVSTSHSIWEPPRKNQHDFSSSFVRALDTGGMVFEGKTKYARLDAALQDLNDGIKRWCKEVGIDFGIEEE